MRCSEFLYPGNIARCQHIKVNGIQCGSPALKRRKYCYFHNQWYQPGIAPRTQGASCFALDIPLLEDANSIQVALMRIIYLLFTNQIDKKKASLMLYALQTASGNLARTKFEPHPQQVVIDRRGVGDTNLGDDAWYREEFTGADKQQERQEAKPQPETKHKFSARTKSKKPPSVADATVDALQILKEVMRN